MCKVLANMTQVSDVAPGPLVFFFVLRQFKIVNLPASQWRKQTSFIKLNCLCMLYGRQTLKKVDQFRLSTKRRTCTKKSVKWKIITIGILIKSITRHLQLQYD
jgi:hypothetical protein